MKKSFNAELRNSGSSAEAGFSLIELLVVVAIIMVITAMAIPSIMRVVISARESSAMTEVAGLLEQARLRAVRDNTNYQVQYTTTSNGRVQFWVDLNHNGTFNTNEPTVYTPQSISVVNSPASTSGLPTSIQNNAATTGNPAFNNRGLPCVYSTTNFYDCPFLNGTTPQNYAIYFTNTAGQSFAVTVQETGRIKSWAFDGSNFH